MRQFAFYYKQINADAIAVHHFSLPCIDSACYDINYEHLVCSTWAKKNILNAIDFAVLALNLPPKAVMLSLYDCHVIREQFSSQCQIADLTLHLIKA
jgi:hypothetical protein